MSLEKLARATGRHGDTHLVHMSTSELHGLEALSRSIHGKGLTRNPETGLPEAFSLGGALKSLLPSIVGGVVGYFTGSPGWSAAAGALVGGIQGKRSGAGALPGAVAGGAGGWAAGKGVAALNTAGGGAAGAPATMSNIGGGIAQLWKDPDKVIGAAASGDKAATGFGGGDQALRTAGMMLAPLTIEEAEALPPGATPEQIAAHRAKQAELFAATTHLKRTYNPSGPSYFTYEREPIRGAAGGAIGFAEGGEPERERPPDITDVAGTKAYTSDAVRNELWGGDRTPLLRLAGPKYTKRVEPTTETPDTTGGGGEPSPGEPLPTTPTTPIETPTVTLPHKDMGETTDVNIRDGNEMGYGGSNWADPNGPSPSESLGGPLEYLMGDPSSDNGLNDFGDTLSDWGGKIAQLEYDYPNTAWTVDKLAALLPGAPLLYLTKYLATKAMNADPNNVHGVNYQNQIDRESDKARQAEADRTETDRLAARAAAAEAERIAAASAGTPSAGDYRNEMDKASDGASGADYRNEMDKASDAYTGGTGTPSAGVPDVGGDFSSDFGGGNFGGGTTDFGGDFGGGSYDWAGGGGGSYDFGGGSYDFGGDWGGGGGGGGLRINHNVDYQMHADGGTVELQSGGFVFPADVVSALGAGSSGAGLEVLAKKFGARPVQGQGHGQSDDVHAMIDGRQEARVARDEAVLDAAQVARIGGGDPKKGAKKLYDVMARVRKQSMGRNKQMKPVSLKELA